MARTFAAGGGQALASALTSRSTSRSYWIWTYRTGDGDSGFGRIWDGSGGTDILSNSGTDYVFTRLWSGSTPQWSVARPSADAWHSIGLSYNGSSTSNTPDVYIDGSLVTDTVLTSAVGTIDNTTGAYCVGNRSSDQARAWDGRLAEFAVWDGILTAADFAALHDGISPKYVRHDLLAEYLPMVRALNSEVIGVSSVVGNTPGFADHPRVARRRPRRWGGYANAPAGGLAANPLFGGGSAANPLWGYLA